jgi:hypothetical protein
MTARQIGQHVRETGTWMMSGGTIARSDAASRWEPAPIMTPQRYRAALERPAATVVSHGGGDYEPVGQAQPAARAWRERVAEEAAYLADIEREAG